jgi:isoamylase/glycogen operon protein
MKTNTIKSERGSATPLGVSRLANGVNFAIFSQQASTVKLCLFSPGSKQPLEEFNLDPDINKTGYVWHILLKDLPTEQIEYGYKIAGASGDPRNAFDPLRTLSDPYAKGLASSQRWGHKDYADPGYIPRGKIILDSPFDWQKVVQPKLPMEELIIYEMHVRSFTEHSSSKVKAPGTFLGMIEKIPYLKNLGVNAIELMPIFEFDECDNVHINPKTNQRLKNYWGYSTINFFAPMNRYSSSAEWTGAMDEFRTLVREMHKEGIEVYLDVVYNHTGEGTMKGPWFSFRGIDNQVYYMVHPDGHYLDFSGTGNTFNANHPVVAKLILDSLRYWVSEMRVDGFRFDLASCLTRDVNGMPLATPPLIQMINSDPVLVEVKLIAEAWDAGGLYQVGHFPCADGRWGEWNGKYRDVVRRFIKGTEGQTADFAKAMSGSQDLYGNGRKPYHSINFVTAHDGFTMRDLVTYQEKHNEENGEDGRDGGNQNDSWNCGQEGPTHNRKIMQLRERQMRNLHAALILAIGTPMILMGDEYGHTRNGNNNAYGHDNALNWFLWDELKAHADFVRFHRLMIQFRKKNPLLHRKEFLKESDVAWHGLVPNKPNWGVENRFLAYTLNDTSKGESLYIAFNAHFEPVHVQLPPLPPKKKWHLVMDTSHAPPNDFYENPHAHPLSYTYDMPDYSAMIAQALQI